jgi:hypothetical protein
MKVRCVHRRQRNEKKKKNCHTAPQNQVRMAKYEAIEVFDWGTIKVQRVTCNELLS